MTFHTSAKSRIGAILTLLFLSFYFCSAVLPAGAQVQKKPADAEMGGTNSPPAASKEQQAYEDFWYGSDPRTRHAAAAQVVGAANPWLMLPLGLAADEFGAWGIETDFGPEQAPPLKSQWLKYVPNGQTFLELPHDNYSKLPLPQRREMLVFSQALIFAGRTPAVGLLNSAKPNEELSWAKLKEEPGKYQGKVVFLKGWLKSLVRRESPPLAAANFVDHYYEGWVYNGFNDKNPIFVTFTELPKEVEPGEHLDLYVLFAGYYFKEFRCLLAGGSSSALFVVARTFRVLSQPTPTDASSAPVLTQEWLKYVKDDRELPKIANKEDSEITPQERFEIKAYTEAQLAVARTSPKAFAASAKENDWVTYAHLFQEPSRFRGKVIPMKGRLVRLRRLETTIESEKQGVKFCYEGWVFTETKNSNPVCVLFAHLPPGAKIGENLDLDVRFNGYFFKRYLYQAGPAGQTKKLRTLLFFAPTFERVKGTGYAELGFGMTTTVLIGIAILAGFTLVLIVVLSWWFRRGDASIRQRVALARQNLQAYAEPREPTLRDEPPNRLAPDYPFDTGPNGTRSEPET